MDSSQIKPNNVEILAIFLEISPSVRFVKWFWSSCNAFIYCRILTKKRCLQLAELGMPLKVHISCIGGLIPLGSVDARFVSRTGKSCVYPDWTSMRLLDATHAAVQCRVSEDISLYKEIALSSPFQRCPKSCLERVVLRAEQEHSVVFLAGFELEFYLIAAGANTPFSQLNDEKPMASKTWSAAACMRGRQARCVEACLGALESAGILVEQGHAESSPDQFEIVIGPLPVVAAVDSLLCAKEIIKEVADSNGYQALFLPKPFEKRQPTGLHLHLSVHGFELGTVRPSVEEYTGARTRDQYEISRDLANEFLAGILYRLPALMAFSMPSENSYLRTSTDDAMGNYISWGSNNSSVPVNEISIGYWEIRSLDWTANIHLALAVYLSAGLLGITGDQPLRWLDPGVPSYELSSTTRETCGITDIIPNSFDDALTTLIHMQYANLQDYIGEELLDLYVLVKQKEHQYLSTLNAEERMSLMLQHF